MNELNRIYNMDCIEGLKLLDDNSIDLVVTDPPYLVTSRGSAGNSGGMLQKKINRSGKVFEYNEITIQEWLPEITRIAKDGSHIYIMCNHVNLLEYLTAIKDVGLRFIKCLIWNKGNKIMGQFYMGQFEYIIFCYKGEAKKINNCGTSDILSIMNSKTKHDDGSNFHDTQKPIALMGVLINNSSNKGDVILDPFMGSGTTAIASMQNQRKFIGFEIDREYSDLANKRIDRERRQVKLWEV